MPIYIKIQFYLFHKKSKRKLLQVSSRGNHQATDTKMNKLTIIVLKSADPYLPDGVEFKNISLGAHILLLTFKININFIF